jgi:hypothetical protein
MIKAEAVLQESDNSKSKGRCCGKNLRNLKNQTAIKTIDGGKTF